MAPPLNRVGSAFTDRHATAMCDDRGVSEPARNATKGAGEPSVVAWEPDAGCVCIPFVRETS